MRKTAMRAAVDKALHDHGLDNADPRANSLTIWVAGLDAKGDNDRFDRPPKFRKVQDAGLLQQRETVYNSVFAAWEADDAERQKQRKSTVHNATRGQQKSGAQNRKESARTIQRQKNQERNRQQYERTKQARRKGKATGGHCFKVADERLETEQKLLGGKFVDVGQRVRVISAHLLAGRCGMVITRAHLRDEDEHGYLVNPPALDAAGAAAIRRPGTITP